jgi:hypothetical protein
MFNSIRRLLVTIFGGIDPQCPWVTVKETTIVPAFKVISVVTNPDKDDPQIHVTVNDENGIPLSGLKVHQWYPDGNPWEITIAGQTQFLMSGDSTLDPNSSDPNHRVGPYRVYVGEDTGTAIPIDVSSDIAVGFGLPLNRHWPYYVVFQKNKIAPEPSGCLGLIAKVFGR